MACNKESKDNWMRDLYKACTECVSWNDLNQEKMAIVAVSNAECNQCMICSKEFSLVNRRISCK